MAEPRIDILADPDALAGKVAQWIVDRARAGQGRFALALSGGSTPRRLYQLLAAEPLRERMPWPRVHLFWSDERCVPRDSADSNYRMAHEAMIAHVPIPPENVHAIPVAASPAAAAQDYERALKAYYGSEALDPARPLFDINLLGMGPDGHTASLFPGKPALDARDRWAVEVPEPGLNPFVPRVTLSYPALDSARAVAFLVAGADKAASLRRVLDGEQALPAARVAPVGELIWFVDRAAMSAV